MRKRNSFQPNDQSRTGRLLLTAFDESEILTEVPGFDRRLLRRSTAPVFTLQECRRLVRVVTEQANCLRKARRYESRKWTMETNAQEELPILSTPPNQSWSKLPRPRLRHHVAFQSRLLRQCAGSRLPWFRASGVLCCRYEGSLTAGCVFLARHSAIPQETIGFKAGKILYVF